ncbi:MAG: pyridoxamine 5'-phosphate oxidase family protein [Planctomycetota bacterium]
MENGMAKLSAAWESREGPAVFATADEAGMPNVVYVAEIRYEARDGFVVTDNYFHKTRANIKNGKPGAILFITKDRKSFQVKGALTYHAEGPVFESMKKWHDPKFPGVAAVVLRIEEAYSGAERLC